LHERLRRLGWAAKEAVQKRAEPNPLRQLIEKDPTLGPILASLPPWEPRRFVGLAPQQTRAYIEDVVSLLPIPEEDDLRELSV
ncbi:MAG: hypothetical protein ACE5GW_09590, partial [Planctomycetota bacterium]